MLTRLLNWFGIKTQAQHIAEAQAVLWEQRKARALAKEQARFEARRRTVAYFEEQEQG